MFLYLIQVKAVLVAINFQLLRTISSLCPPLPKLSGNSSCITDHTEAQHTVCWVSIPWIYPSL